MGGEGRRGGGLLSDGVKLSLNSAKILVLSDPPLEESPPQSLPETKTTNTTLTFASCSCLLPEKNIHEKCESYTQVYK